MMNSPTLQSNLAPMSSGEKLLEGRITKGRGMLTHLHYTMKQKRCGSCIAFNTVSNTKVQLQDPNPLTKSLHEWSWVNSTSMHPTAWSFPVGCDAQKPCTTNHSTTFWKSLWVLTPCLCLCLSSPVKLWCLLLLIAHSEIFKQEKQTSITKKLHAGRGKTTSALLSLFSHCGT